MLHPFQISLVYSSSYVLVRNAPLSLQVLIGIFNKTFHSFSSCITFINYSYLCESNSELEAIMMEHTIKDDNECFGCMH